MTSLIDDLHLDSSNYLYVIFIFFIIYIKIVLLLYILKYKKCIIIVRLDILIY